MIKKFLIDVLDFIRFKRSYSQDGEDMVLRALFENHPKGFKGTYVDVGAHHPVRFSNTYFFYLKGWRGVNIDPTPGSMRPFRWMRRRDTNLEIAIGPEVGNLMFYCFDEPALNTVSEEVALARESGGRYKIIKKVNVPVLPLAQVLAEHLKQDEPIAFLSVDVEGFDEMVLKSNDWQRFRPLYVLAEDFWITDELNKNESGVTHFLLSQGYKMVAATKRTLIFKDARSSQ
ncbi:MAG: FkbM family methyltransferase [Bacteroidota bacterium]